MALHGDELAMHLDADHEFVLAQRVQKYLGCCQQLCLVMALDVQNLQLEADLLHSLQVLMLKLKLSECVAEVHQNSNCREKAILVAAAAATVDERAWGYRHADIHGFCADASAE
jgi:hypothetical protein